MPSSFRANLSCKNPLKGANPVPGPTITIGIKGSAGNLKLEDLIKIGAWLQSLLFCRGIAFFIQVEHTPL
uniref:Uncharacterized protein MANES_18G058200 n=1 Tax=Rhizophora mucronata TaxID=61149 RepID=A0A2P2MDJ2_RHIMU